MNKKLQKHKYAVVFISVIVIFVVSLFSSCGAQGVAIDEYTRDTANSTVDLPQSNASASISTPGSVSQTSSTKNEPVSATSSESAAPITTTQTTAQTVQTTIVTSSSESTSFSQTSYHIETAKTSQTTASAQIKYVTVYFYNDDGTLLKAEKVENGGSAVPPPSPVKKGYAFTGWDSSYSNVTKNTIVTAKYSKDSLVVFVMPDGTIIKSEYVPTGKSATAPTPPEITGYIFSGWNREFTNITEDAVITAIYTNTNIDQSGARITVETCYASSGETVNVKISVFENPGIAGALITVGYDKNIELISAKNGTALSELTYTAPGKYANPCNFSWDSEKGESAIDGEILTLSFKVPKTAKQGDRFSISCSYRNGDIFDENLEDVTLSVINGEIIIK